MSDNIKLRQELTEKFNDTVLPLSHDDNDKTIKACVDIAIRYIAMSHISQAMGATLDDTQIQTVGRAIALAEGEDYMEDYRRYDKQAEAAYAAVLEIALTASK